MSNPLLSIAIVLFNPNLKEFEVALKQLVPSMLTVAARYQRTVKLYIIDNSSAEGYAAPLETLLQKYVAAHAYLDYQYKKTQENLG